MLVQCALDTVRRLPRPACHVQGTRQRKSAGVLLFQIAGGGLCSAPAGLCLLGRQPHRRAHGRRACAVGQPVGGALDRGVSSWSASLPGRRIRADWSKLEDKAGVLTFLALTGGTAFGTLQFVALQYTTALNMGVVGSVSPAFIVAASYLLFRDGLGPRQLVGVSCRSSACWPSSASSIRGGWRAFPSTAATSSSSSTWHSGRSIAPACGCGPPCTP